MKPTDIYASNHAVSVASDQIAEHIDKLRQAGLIDAAQARQRIASVEEIRALTSADVCSNMVDSELGRARDAQQKKLAIERKWKKAEPRKTRRDSAG